MSDPDMELRMYIVAFGEGATKANEWLVAARSHSEAFELWRGADDRSGESMDYTVDIWPVPPLPDTPGTVEWPYAEKHTFDPDYDDLTTRAVRASREKDNEP